MIKSTKHLKAFIGVCLIVLQLSNAWCRDLSTSVVQVYSGLSYSCPGTMVEENFIVTTAECVHGHIDGTFLTVWATVDKVRVARIFRPTDYNKATGDMNVAVLKLERAMAEPTIKPIDLCKKASIDPGETLTVYYWGIGDILKSSNLTVTNKEDCAKTYGNKLPNTMFCAADSGGKYYIGDDGGPAVYDGQFCAIYHFGENNFPGLLTSLTNATFVQFIKDSLKN